MSAVRDAPAPHERGIRLAPSDYQLILHHITLASSPSPPVPSTAAGHIVLQLPTYPSQPCHIKYRLRPTTSPFLCSPASPSHSSLRAEFECMLRVSAACPHALFLPDFFCYHSTDAAELLVTPHYPTTLSAALSSSICPTSLSVHVVVRAQDCLLSLFRGGVLYNDWKPEHLFLDGGVRLVLIDYDLASPVQPTAESSQPAFAGSPFFASVSAHYALPPSLSSNAESLLYCLYHALVRPLPWTVLGERGAAAPPSDSARQQSSKPQLDVDDDALMELLLSSVEDVDDDEEEQRLQLDALGDAKLRELLGHHSEPSADPVFALFIDAFVLPGKGQRVQHGDAIHGENDERRVQRAFDLFLRAHDRWSSHQSTPTPSVPHTTHRAHAHERDDDGGESQPPLLTGDDQSLATDVRSFLLQRLGLRLLVHPALPPGNPCAFVPPSTSALRFITATCTRLSFPCLCSPPPPPESSPFPLPLLTTARHPLLVLCIGLSADLPSSFLALAHALNALLPPFSSPLLAAELGDDWPVLCVVCGKDEYEGAERWLSSALRGRGLMLDAEWAWLRVWSVLQRLLCCRMPVSEKAGEEVGTQSGGEEDTAAAQLLAMLSAEYRSK